MDCTPEEAEEGLAIVRVLAVVLDRLVGANSHVPPNDPSQVTKFQALKAPGIGIMQYLERIHKYASCSNECFILALIYIDRLIQRNEFLLSELNVHRVVITAILLAAKFFDDAYYNNAYYAKVGGVLTSEMNGLEVDFLFRINFSLHVTPELFEKYRTELISHSVTVPMNSQPEMQPVTAQLQVQGQVPPVQEHSPYYQPEQTTHSDIAALHTYTCDGTPDTSFHVTPSPNMVSSSGLPRPEGSVENVIVGNTKMQHYYPTPSVGVQYLQRTNSMPNPKANMQVVPGSQTQQAPQYYSAPTMAGMSSESFPVMGNVEQNGQYVVVDNQIFQLQGMHPGHGVDANEILIHGKVQNSFHQHNHNASNAYVTCDASSPFSGGPMLASVSGGM